MEKSEDRIFFGGSVEFAGWRRLHQGQRPVKVLPSTFYPFHLFVRVFLVHRFSFPCNFTLLPPQTCSLSSPYLIWSFPFFPFPSIYLSYLLWRTFLILDVFSSVPLSALHVAFEFSSLNIEPYIVSTFSQIMFWVVLVIFFRILCGFWTQNITKEVYFGLDF